MVREAGVIPAGEAVEMGIHHRGTPVGRVGTEAADQEWQGGGLEQLASVHDGLLSVDGWGKLPIPVVPSFLGRW
jgi:hypothetical protein